MKQLKKDLQAVLKSLKLATDTVGKLMKKVEKLDKPVASKKPRSKALPKAKKPRAKALPKAKKPKKVSDSDAVLAIIKRFKKGVDGATLRKKTGFEGRKIRDIIYRLKKRGEIKVKGKGIYLKA